ncbi:MAG: hypothetical protein R3304_06430 [Longimicrobiales bacterium]|nr:hypothetical protein [Longimicrobiales bacterium]
MRRSGLRRWWARMGIAGLCASAPSLAVSQESLSPGMELNAALEVSDPVDESGYVHDLFIVDAPADRRIVVTVESSRFDPFLEWGVVRDGRFESWGGVDDSEGLPSPTDARLFLDVDPPSFQGATPALRVSSVAGGPGGVYRIRMEEAEGGTLDVRRMDYGSQTSASLTETDALRGHRFVDVYLFRGEVGERALVALEAEYDAFLMLSPPPDPPAGMGPWENDDDFGGTDAFLEIDIPVTGEYEIVVTSFSQERGRYTLRLWDEPSLAPALGGDSDDLAAWGAGQRLSRASADRFGISFTEDERGPLHVVEGAVENGQVGFRFPAPVPALSPSPSLAEEISGADLPPNMATWGLASADDRTQIIVLGIRSLGPVTRAMLEMISADAQTSLAADSGFGQGVETIFEEFSWEDRTYELGFTGTTTGVFGLDEPERARGELYCRGTDEATSPGILICLLGLSRDDRSFLHAFEELEIG